MTSYPGGASGPDDGAPPLGSPTGAALAAVRERYASWLTLDRERVLADRDEEPDQIRALQLVVRMEREHPPDWYTALELAARACALLVLDPRGEPGGEWYDAIRAYCAGHIRKVTRRARAGHWEATADFPGIGLERGDTQVRAIVPGPIGELDKRLARLQVGGTDAPRSEPESWPEVPAGTLVIHPSPHVPMSLGKAMAQAGHAGMIAPALLAADAPRLASWYAAGAPVAARPATDEAWDDAVAALRDPQRAWQGHGLVAVRDAGFTEIDPGTVTVIARLRA